MYLKNAWYVGATSEEVAGSPLGRTILDEPVVFYRDEATKAVVALEDRCCHRGAPLSSGFLSPKGIVCGYHGIVFDESGAAIEIPGQDKIPARARVQAYPIAERSGFCWIWMGDPTRADEQAIPQIPDHTPADDERPRFAHGVVHVKASYALILENLMDLTHLAYVHKGTIGSRPDVHAGATMDTEVTDIGVRLTRTMLNANPPAEFIEKYGFAGNVDRFEEFDYISPATVLQSSGMVDAGKYVQGIRTGGHRLRVIHTFAPEFEYSCHYFYSFISDYVGHQNSSDGEAIVGAVLSEDAAMVELQQERLKGYDMSKLTAIASDSARVQMARFLERKIAEDQREPTLAR